MTEEELIRLLRSRGLGLHEIGKSLLQFIEVINRLEQARADYEEAWIYKMDSIEEAQSMCPHIIEDNICLVCNKKFWK